MNEFLSHIYNIVGYSIEKYLGKEFNHLSVSFGCTGGRHRSVYCAERLAEYLKQRKNIVVEIDHIEEESWRKLLWVIMLTICKEYKKLKEDKKPKYKCKKYERIWYKKINLANLINFRLSN